MLETCPDCGAAVGSDEDFCGGCGTNLVPYRGGPGRQAGKTSKRSPREMRGDTGTVGGDPYGSDYSPGLTFTFKAAVLAVLLFVTGILVLPSYAARTTSQSVDQIAIGGFYLGILMWPVSVLLMYADLKLDKEHLWDVRPLAWLLGAILLYFLVMPFYIVARIWDAR